MKSQRILFLGLGVILSAVMARAQMRAIPAMKTDHPGNVFLAAPQGS